MSNRIKTRTLLATRLLSIILGSVSLLPTLALADRVQTQQPKSLWYRTYEQGTPALSSTITDQHIRNGYEVLDRNMQVIRRVQPYVAAQYEQQKAQRDRADAQRQADRNLVAVHISSLHAAAKRDSLVAEMQGRKQFLNKQLDELKRELSKDIASAATYERRQQAVPELVRQRLTLKREQVAQAEINVQALEKRQLDIMNQYKEITNRLIYIENNRSVLQAPERAAPR